MQSDATEALKTGGARTTGDKAGARTREALTVLQVALSLTLLSSAGLVLRSLTNLHEVDPGFDPRHVLLVEINPTWVSAESAQRKVARYQRILDRIAALPEVAAVGANNSPPFVGQHPWNRAEFTGEGQSLVEQRQNPRANFQTVSADYFRVLRIPLLRGRSFDARDHLGAPEVCIVSEALAQRLWPGRDPLGRKVRFGAFDDAEGEEWMTVVGVVGNIRHQSLAAPPGPDIYKPTQQLAWKQMHYLVRLRPEAGKNPVRFFPTLRRAVAEVAPEVGVFDPVSLEEELSDSLWQPTLRAWLLGLFAVFALLLAASGLYGVVAFGVAQRTREIGIRIALGATRQRILQLVVRQGMRAVGIGVVLGMIAALLLGRLLASQLYEVSAANPVVLTGASALLLLVGLGACLAPARRASRVDPMEALRHE